MNPLKYISANVAITEIGIAVPMIRVLEILRRKKSKTNTARPAPTSAASITLLMEARMNSAESQVLSIVTGNPPAFPASLMRSSSSQMASEALTVLDPDCL